MIRLVLDTELERGKCYTFAGTVAANTNVIFYIGNEVQKTFLLQVTTAGAEFSFSHTKDTLAPLNYTTASTLYNSLYVEFITEGDITNLAVKLDEQCALEYCSECFKLEDCTYPSSQELVYLEWTNKDDGFGFDYTSLPLIHSVWLKGGLRDDDYTYDEEYFSTSNGRHFPVYVDAVKTQALYINEIPAYIHDAIRLGVVHDDFKINGVRFTKAEGGYNPDWNTPESLLAGVIVRVREQTQNTKNYHC